MTMVVGRGVGDFPKAQQVVSAEPKSKTNLRNTHLVDTKSRKGSRRSLASKGCFPSFPPSFYSETSRSPRFWTKESFQTRGIINCEWGLQAIEFSPPCLFGSLSSPTSRIKGLATKAWPEADQPPEWGNDLEMLVEIRATSKLTMVLDGHSELQCLPLRGSLNQYQHMIWALSMFEGLLKYPRVPHTVLDLCRRCQ